MVISQEGKQAAVFDFYDNILGKAEERDYTFDLDVLGVQQHDLSSLDVPFSEEEVWATIKELHLDKAPGQMVLLGGSISLAGTLLKVTS